MSEQFATMGGMQFPKPGKVLMAVLCTVAGLAIVGGAWVTWGSGADVFSRLIFIPSAFLRGEVWRLFTAGWLTQPGGPGSITHLLFTLVGLYFLSPDLERRWGGRRYFAFLVATMVSGFLLALVAWKLSSAPSVLHREAIYGTGATITGLAVAWARANAHREIRLFFVIPVKGSQLFLFTIGWCVLAVIMGDESTEGVVAPFGGILAGMFFGGAGVPLRTTYLQWKLAWLRKRQGGGLSAASMLENPAPKRRPGSPPLRVVQGGLDDDGPKREPPRDKRYLN